MTGRQRPTRRQLDVLRAYIAAGSIPAAAYELGITETTARQHLSGLYRRTGSANAVQAAYRLGVAMRHSLPGADTASTADHVHIERADVLAR